MAQEVTILTSDKQILIVEDIITKKSVVIKAMLNDIGRENNSKEPIHLPNIHSSTLKNVMEWVKHHKNDILTDWIYQKKCRYDEHHVLSPWDKMFFDRDRVSLLELILAANILDIHGLVNAACKAVADIIKNKTVDEIRLYFNIENDLTPAKEQQISEENAWCETHP